MTFSAEGRTRRNVKPLACGVLLVGVLATSACGGGSRRAAKSLPVAVKSEDSIHVGQTRIFDRVRPGDTIGCLGHADSVSPVPRRSAGGNVYSNAWDKKLSLTIGARDPRSPHQSQGIVASRTSR